MRYEHTQKSPFFWIFLIFGGFILVVGKFSAASAVVGMAVILIALCFGRMTVSDKGDALSIQFGPLPVFGARFDYSEIADVAPARSSLIDGWGIHWLPGRGRIYNVWGFDCVRMTFRDKTVRIGTDDLNGLLQALKEKTDGGGLQTP
jgi:hypothetical protein